MGERDAFLSHIIREPECDAHRLVYADWLEEHGGATLQARLIRDMVARPDARLFGFRDPGYNRFFWKIVSDGAPLQAFCGRYRAARRQLPESASFVPYTRLSLRRGFVESIVCTSATWMKSGDAIVSLHPLTRVLLRRGEGITDGEFRFRLRHDLREKLLQRREHEGAALIGSHPLLWTCQQLWPQVKTWKFADEVPGSIYDADDPPEWFPRRFRSRNRSPGGSGMSYGAHLDERVPADETVFEAVARLIPHAAPE